MFAYFFNEQITIEEKQMKKYSILLVDNDPLITKGTGDDLDREGYEVATADSGEKAIELLENATFDLVITDLVMGPINGIGVLKRTKEINPETMVVILTGFGDMATAVEAFRRDADDYILKPCEPEEMYFRVSKCIEKLELKRKIKRQQERKIETITTLAGGIAHNFNNALSSIISLIDLLLMEYPEDEKITEYAQTMKQSAHRMAHLTKQLLDYARGGKYFPLSMSSSSFVESSLPIIQHILNPDIRLETHLPSDVMNAAIDSIQMEMVLSAMVTNSNEAIEGPGHVTISTKNTNLDQGFMEVHPSLKPGPYICISIEDDGKGMDEKTRERILDPFFTTHFIGRGLGMAAVYGIVRNHNGGMSVDSEPGKGTVVRIYLPAIEAQG
jgi:signal transduction histidine kinase